MLKSIGVEIGESELAMAVLNEHSERFFYIITSLHATGEKAQSLDLIKSQLLKEERRNCMRYCKTSSEAALYSSSIAAQANRSIQKYSFCGWEGHREETCGKKFPSLRPEELTSATSDRRQARSAFIYSGVVSSENECAFTCFMLVIL